MESRKHCAYNQTRECFLGLEVAVADVSYAGLQNMFATLALKPGEGLWIAPFRGIPETGLRVPLDLIYLDDECRVIDAVESFPTFRITSSSPAPASVLALPAHSIYSSQTQQGDQLVLCVAEEMERRLEGFSRLGGGVADIQSAALVRERPLWSGGPGVLQLEDRSQPIRPKSNQTHEMGLIQPGTKDPRPPRSWLERWWSPDPRKAPREASPGLAAYYWTGGPPEAHNIKDISSTGLYIVTEERWYPGTLVLMVLTKTDDGEESAERSISVHSRAVRLGNDGVGMQFILHDGADGRRQKNSVGNSVGRAELDQFLQRLRKES